MSRERPKRFAIRERTFKLQGLFIAECCPSGKGSPHQGHGRIGIVNEIALPAKFQHFGRFSIRFKDRQSLKPSTFLILLTSANITSLNLLHPRNPFDEMTSNDAETSNRSQDEHL
jgi:hypothetical protein